MPNLGVECINRHEEYYLRDGNVCFLVEKTLFRLHRHFFERESDYFRAWLNTPAEAEGGSLDRPYIIHDAKSDEFAQFIWVWYNPQYTFAKQSKQSWFTILRLATQWRFHEIRKLAIRQLERINFEPIEKIVVYKEYSVDQGLLLPSYVTLCRSPTLPSPEEGKMLTMETILKLASAREQAILSASERGFKTPTTATLPDDVLNTIVADLFGLTLQSNDQTVQMEGQTKNTSGDGPADPEVVTVKQPNPAKKGKPNGAVSQESPQPGPIPTTNGVSGKGKHTK